MLAEDIGRKGDLAEAIGDRHDRLAARGGEGDAGDAVARLGENRGREGAGLEEHGSLGEFAARPEKAPPFTVRSGRAQQEAFDLPAARPLRKEARRQHRGIIAHKKVAGEQQVRQVGKDMVRHRVRQAVDDEQARLVAAGRGGLRDQALRQRIIEEFGAEAHVSGPERRPGLVRIEE